MAKKKAKALKRTARRTAPKARKAKRPAPARKPARTVRRTKISKTAKTGKTAIQKRQLLQPAMELPRKMPVGTVMHFYTDISVCVIDLTDKLRVGEWISIEGATTNLRQKVASMQVNRQPVSQASAGDSIGLKVADRVREGDRVFRV